MRLFIYAEQTVKSKLSKNFSRANHPNGSPSSCSGVVSLVKLCMLATFDFHAQVDRLAKANLLYLVTDKFANIDLHPDVVSNAQMGGVFEELIRKFAEISNETAGEHFTPREVIRLMVNLLFIEDDAALSKPGVVRSLEPLSRTNLSNGDARCWQDATQRSWRRGHSRTVCLA